MTVLKGICYLLVIIFLGSLLIFGFVDIFGSAISEVFSGFRNEMTALSLKYPVAWRIGLFIFSSILLIISLNMLFSTTRP
ncbi:MULTISPECIES: hypothetical protein [Staphylococcus]|uniref:hypothetical protein n=1 Tax=Staphylococcus TaxID=1279 RepID=UPI000A79989E|nr:MULTISPECIES: hypothetical protein [Staphylococcus]GJF96914.1 hypothetical protein SASC252_23730 [Staphylococcus argenteus]GJG02269.1 hypothetical protein SASC254_24310 [Staphylococcus argenteus]GJG04866.1 hypothetical protein SASC256_23610 [Staphylococcus argenteus]GJG07494.1 hypothetical protein SASC257_23260 [Staphylococcus argenteus]GJG10456.1 hypothetical protein SASC260_26240 [Staphylococcus argenteus]